MKSVYGVLIALFLVVLLLGALYISRHNESYSRRQGEFLREVIIARKRAEEYAMTNNRASYQSEAALGAPDSIFFPAPVISGRVQSTQYEHLAAEMPLIDMDYQPINNWPIEGARASTKAAFQDAVDAQIVLVQKTFDHQLKHVLQSPPIANDIVSIFAEAHKRTKRIMQNWSTTNHSIQSLQKYQRQLSDELQSSVSAVLDSHGIELLVVNGPKSIRLSTKQKATSSRLANELSTSQFNDKPIYRVDGHRLTEAPLKQANAISTLSSTELLQIAQTHVRNVYAALIDKYKYLIQEMPAVNFQSEASHITSVGSEMAVDYIRANHPSARQLGRFQINVKEAMREALFEILLTNKVDVQQFGDVTQYT